MTPTEHELSIEELNKLFFYDKEGFLVEKTTRNSRATKGKIVGSSDGKGYLTVNINKRRYRVHRIIWAMHNNRWPEDEIDHIDRNKSNNKIENLREASRSINSLNRRKNGYYKCDEGYRAQLRFNKKTYIGPRRASIEEALHDFDDFNASVTQLVECLSCKEEVRDSNSL